MVHRRPIIIIER